jgi:hypothetical protein
MASLIACTFENFVPNNVNALLFGAGPPLDACFSEHISGLAADAHGNVLIAAYATYKAVRIVRFAAGEMSIPQNVLHSIDCTSNYLSADVHCPLGFACPCGAPQPCTDPSSFCPGDTTTPFPVSPGFYAVSQAASNGSQVAAGHLYTSQLMCEPGWYCVAGVKTACPVGTVRVRRI